MPDAPTALRDLAELLRSERITRTTLADGSGVLLDVDGLHVYSLNDTGMTLVEALSEGVDDGAELARRLTERFEVDEVTARADVAEFVAELGTLLSPRR